MAISNETAAAIVFGADKLLHLRIRGAMLRLARIIRDSTDGTHGELRQRWARQVMAGDDSTYGPILRELSLRPAIQDGYAGDSHAELVVQNAVLAVLDSVISARG